MSDEIKQLVLDKRKEGKVVFTTLDGYASADVSKFIKQPTDGILYHLNRLEEVALTFIDDPKWVNDFAVALTIRALKAENETLRAAIIRTLQIPIGAVLDQSTRFVLTDALKAGEVNYAILADTQESER